jgi:hypothetical protein
MVHRYQETLNQDDELSQRLACLRVERRRILPFALALLPVTLFGTAVAIHDRTSLILVVVGCAAAASVTTKFFRERRIIQGRWSATVGTVLSRRRTGGRRGVQIKYGFRSADGKVCLGKAVGGVRLPQEGATLGILYDTDRPSRSLPLSKFLFCEFSFGPQQHESRVVSSAAADPRQLQ